MKSLYKVFSIDETLDWELPGLSEMAKIRGVYLYDSSETTNCCEITPSYECHKLYSILVDDDLEDKERKPLEDDIGQNDHIGITIYVHCSTIDASNPIAVEGDFDNIQEAIEEARANCLI